VEPAPALRGGLRVVGGRQADGALPHALTTRPQRVAVPGRAKGLQAQRGPGCDLGTAATQRAVARAEESGCTLY